MRSPHIIASLSPDRRSEPSTHHDERQHGDDDDASTHSMTSSKHRKSSIPPPRASLSSFAAPSWNNGAIGEQNSSIRVVARIRPLHSSSHNDEGDDNDNGREAVFAIGNTDHNDNDTDTTAFSDVFSSPPSKSTPPRSGIGKGQGQGVADIAARFNTNPGSPIAPDLPSIITTPTKFMHCANSSSSSSPSPYYSNGLGSRSTTPIHTNVDTTQPTRNTHRHNLIPLSSNRQCFIQPPSSPSSMVNSNVKESKRASQQTIAAGLADPKTFDFDAVSNNLLFHNHFIFYPTPNLTYMYLFPFFRIPYF